MASGENVVGGRILGGSSGRRYDVGPFKGVTMAQARKLHAAGTITASPARMAGKHPSSVRRSMGSGVTIDLTEMNKLATGLRGVAAHIEHGKPIISRAINFGLRKIRTRVAKEIKQWTGIRVTGKVHDSMRLNFASPGKLTGFVNFQSGHTVVTRKYFGASWSRGNPGATHVAWNRRQIATGTFMIPGKEPVFQRLPGAKKRLSRSGKWGAFPIDPIYGPNMTGEVIRHRAEVQILVDNAGRLVAREAARLMKVAIDRAGTR